MIELLSLVAAMFGLSIGSFLNVVVYRLPLGDSVVSPRSSCPCCKTQINWFDNIPIVSFLALRGKCRHCGSLISWRYPLIEGLTGFAFGAIAWTLLREDFSNLGLQLVRLATLLLLVAISIALTAIDLEHLRLPNVLLLTLFVTVLASHVVQTAIVGQLSQLTNSLLAATGLASFFLLVRVVAPNGMGMGDVKLAAVIGLVLGWYGLHVALIGLMASFVLGGVFGVILLLSGRANGKSRVAFGPWMIAAMWLAILFGQRVWEQYLSLFGIF